MNPFLSQIETIDHSQTYCYCNY